MPTPTTREIVRHKTEGFGPTLTAELTAAGLVQYDPNIDNEADAQFTGLTTGADSDPTKVVVFVVDETWTPEDTVTLDDVIEAHVPSTGSDPVPDDG